MVPAQMIGDLNGSQNHIQQLVVTTKAFDALTALQSVEGSLDGRTTSILILCNGGLAVRNELQDYLQGKRLHRLGDNSNKVPSIYVGSVTHGIYRRPLDDGFSVVQAGVGRIFVPNEVSTEHLKWPGVESVSAETMEMILWKKLAANSVCNPLTALYQCTNGAMKQVVPDFDTVLHEVIHEITQVQHAVGGNGFLEFNKTVEFVHQVIADNAENYSSMQQDIFYERRTEIDYLNAYTVQIGHNHGIACPRNDELVQRIRQIEARFPNNQDLT
jgi:2-dehydropantoate 2-reductase